MDPAEILARYVAELTYDGLPAEAIEATKKDVLDTLATALAGTAAPGVQETVEFVREQGGRPDSQVIGAQLRVPASAAAFANGTAAHALDFDDTHDAAVLHAGVSVVPAAFAIAERRGGVNGREFIAAVAAGVDVVCRMGLATRYGPNTTGWLLTSIYGYFGAAMAAARFLRFDADRTLMALGIAYSRAAGNNQCIVDGSLTKRLQAGFAASGGIIAALLAERGLTGPRNTMQGKWGLYNVYQRGEWIPEALTAELGSRFEVANLSFKPYPCCRYNHTAIDAALCLWNEGLRAEEIAEVTAFVGSEGYNAVCSPIESKRQPENIVTAQFSIPYSVAAALVNGSVTTADLTDEAIRRPAVLALAAKVDCIMDPEIDAVNARGISPARLRVLTKSGEVRQCAVDVPKGGALNPFTLDDLGQKFSQCAKQAHKPLDDASSRQAVDLIAYLEGVEDVARIMDVLR